MATGSPIPALIREAAIRQFMATWQDYPTVSAAVVEVAQMHEVGRTTLQEWLMADDLWPSPRRRVVWLEREIARLQEQLARCQCGESGRRR